MFEFRRWLGRWYGLGEAGGQVEDRGGRMGCCPGEARLTHAVRLERLAANHAPLTVTGRCPVQRDSDDAVVGTAEARVRCVRARS